MTKPPWNVPDAKVDCENLMHPTLGYAIHQTRRQFLTGVSGTLGFAALSSLLNDGHGQTPATARNDGALAGLPHFTPKARRVIYLMQTGAPTHVDLFDYKPNIYRYRGTQLPDSVRMGQRLTTMTAGQQNLAVLPGIAPFRRWGQCGQWLCDFLPHTGSIADDICVIRSMHTDAINHAPAVTLFLTGPEQPGRPSMGAWLSYGLGSMNRDLPTFVVMTSQDRELSCGQIFYDYYWGAGFLPSSYKGVKLRSNGDPVLYLSNPQGIPSTVRRSQLDDLAALNQLRHQEVGDPEIQTRIGRSE